MPLLFAVRTPHGMRTFGECVSLLPAVATPWRVDGAEHSLVFTGPAPATRDWIGTLGLNVTLSPTIETRGVGSHGTSCNIVTIFLAPLTPRRMGALGFTVAFLQAIVTNFLWFHH